MPGSPSLPPRPTLTRYAIAVETAAQAQAIQTFLWCVWLTALAQLANSGSARSESERRNESETFGYDALDRLISSGAGTGNGTALPDSGSFGYDSAGNLNSAVGRNACGSDEWE